MTRCFSCGAELPHTLPFHRSDRCPQCDAGVRVCLNCRFYDPGSHWECREHIPEPVRDKDRANFCDYFQRRHDGGAAGTGDADDDPTSARDAFNKLFGG